MVDPAKRVVYVDANVFDQINRGNADAARTLRRLLDDPHVDVRVPPWVRRELVDQPELPRTAAANRLMLAELGIRDGAAPNLAERVDTTLAGETRAGGNVASLEDRQMIASARAGKAEIWSFDKSFRVAGKTIEKQFGVRVAPESTSVPMVQNQVKDFRVGRQLLKLEPVEITFKGTVIRAGGKPPDGGGGGGGVPPAGAGSPPTVTRPAPTVSSGVVAGSSKSPGGVALVPVTTGPLRAPTALKRPAGFRVSMSRQWRTSLRGGARAARGSAAAVLLSLLGAQIQSSVDQRRIEADFAGQQDRILSEIERQSAAVLAAAAAGGPVYACVRFELEYHLLWEPTDRIESTVYAGLAVTAVGITTTASDSLDELPIRTPGEVIEIVRVRGETSIELPVTEMLPASELNRARLQHLEDQVNRGSWPPAELQRLQRERDALLQAL